MKVHQVESMGFIWTSKDGSVEGNIARVEVEYAGVTGIIQAELVDAQTAVAFAATCTPDFMVVCALAKDRQAVFKKISVNQISSADTTTFFTMPQATASSTVIQ